MEKRDKTYEVVIDAINKMVKDGAVTKGDRLPAERQLAIDLGVSRTSIREALKTLEVIGLLERRHGGGTFIKDDFTNALERPLSLLLAFDRIEMREILELRTMVEAEMTYHAAKQISDEEIEELRELLRLMLDTEDETISTQYDKQFHFAIAKASRNHIILSLFQVINNLLDEFIKEIRYIVSLDDNKLVDVAHINIFEAIEAKDPDRARKAMGDHMKIVNDYFKQEIK
jgi:GntR family transcriptional repressor for pyruvate dehydrogenase complex